MPFGPVAPIATSRAIGSRKRAMTVSANGRRRSVRKVLRRMFAGGFGRSKQRKFGV
jgi:hypothetical protein